MTIAKRRKKQKAAFEDKAIGKFVTGFLEAFVVMVFIVSFCYGSYYFGEGLLSLGKLLYSYKPWLLIPYIITFLSIFYGLYKAAYLK